ncbi:MAG: molybdopterin-guanine dinucleotide biosynthesis protein B [Desulfobacterales bacterium]
MIRPAPTPPPVVSIVGRSGSGKTTLIERLLAELTRRGYRIGTIKHTHHEVRSDREGKDSARHRAAGAVTVVLAAEGEIALFKDAAGSRLEELLRYFDDVDLVLTEGYKRERRPKIEVLRAAVGGELLCRFDPTLIAVAADAPLEAPVPVFPLDDAAGLADFIAARFLRAAAPAARTPREDAG